MTITTYDSIQKTGYCLNEETLEILVELYVLKKDLVCMNLLI